MSEGEKDGVNAVKRAWRAMATNIVEAVIYMLILSLIAFIGFLLCCVGIFVTIPIGVIGQYFLAKQLTDDGTIQ